MNKKNLTLVELTKSGDFEHWCDAAMIDVFEGLFQAVPKFSKELVDDQNQFEVSGVVAFMTDDVEAVLQLSCSKQTLLNLSHYLTGEAPQDDRAVLAIGEATNILFCYIKDKLNDHNLYYEKCLPIVIYGQNHIVLNINRAVTFNQIYKTSYGLFNLKVGFNHKSVLTKAS